MKNFLEYFQLTWLDGIFAIRLWNKYGQDHLHRTNNAVESWHSGLSGRLPCHPNIFIFFNEIKRRQSLVQLSVLRADNGEDRPRRKRKYVELEDKLSRIHREHVNGVIGTEQLLRQARHCCKKYR